jgi:hypothetical protein
MNKLATSAVAAIMAAGLTAASASPDAAGTAAPERTQHVKRLVLHAVESHSPAPDKYLGVDRLRSLATHEIAGYDNFAGYTPHGTHRVRFWLSLSLTGGLIDSYFDTPGGAKTFSGRITHGSGRFRGIRGTIDVRIGDSGRTVYTLRYSL